MFDKLKKFILNNKVKIVLSAILVICSYFIIAGELKTTVNPTDLSSDQTLGTSFSDSQWYTVDKFQGYQTQQDATKLPIGANPNGQNTQTNDGDRISARDYGYEVLGTSTTTEDGITSLHTFRKRSGENILIRSRGTYLEYWEEGSNAWESLRTTSTDGADYGYADYNINSDLRSYVYFGNATDNFARWTGAHSTTTATIAVGTTTIWVTDTTDFLATGTARYCDIDIVYSAKTATTLTVATTTATCAAGRGITQAITEYPTYPKGNIYLVANNRIFIGGITSTPQAVYFSKYGDATTWLTTLVSDSTADAAGIFNFGEGGGAVTGMTQDEGSIYMFKKNITYKVTLSDSLYTLQPLKPFDGKSQTTGNTNRKLIFTGSNGTYFVTPDNQIMSLSRIAQVDYPQISPISYTIQPTVDGMDFSSGSGIFWKQSAYFSAKSSSDSYSPDTVLVFNSVTNSWESPIIGWAATDFAVYDDGDGEALYFGDATSANIYKVINESSDNDLPFVSSWRSKQFNFSEIVAPADMKEIDSIFVEGYISDNTEITISLLLDEDGFTQQFSTTIDGATDTGYLFSSTPYNIFGLHPFGYLRFGSSDAAGLKKFRVYLSKDFRAYPFYNAQVEFESSSDGQSWEITSFGFKVRKATQSEKRSLYKAFR